MRLSKPEVAAIEIAAREAFKQFNIDVYLFGSRTDDTKKGGDIDLLVVALDGEIEQILDRKLEFSHRIQDRIGEQRIDITITTADRMKTDPFQLSVQDELILLFRS